MSIFEETEMSDEDYKKVVIRIGTAFKELPDNAARFEVLASLAKLMLRDGAASPGLAESWLDTAQASLEGCARFCRLGKGK